MTRIFLIRHAEAEGNIYRRAHGHFNGQITQMGFAQIDRLRERFINEKIDAVYSSDLDRTCTTAAAISVPRGMHVNKTSQLREVDIGVWEDMAWGDIEHHEPEMIKFFNSDPASWHVKGSEEFGHVQARMVKCITEIGESHVGETVAVFSHGFAIRALMCRLLDIPSYEIARNPYCDNSAVALLLYDNGSLTMKFQGDNSHLCSEISTFARQSWWRNEQEYVKENLRYIMLEPDGEFEYFDADFRLARQQQGRAEKEYLALLGTEPVGFLGLDADNSGVGRIACIYIKSGLAEKKFLVQLIGHAISELRKLQMDTVCVGLPHGDESIPIFTNHGFELCTLDTTRCKVPCTLRSEAGMHHISKKMI